MHEVFSLPSTLHEFFSRYFPLHEYFAPSPYHFYIKLSVPKYEARRTA